MWYNVSNPCYNVIYPLLRPTPLSKWITRSRYCRMWHGQLLRHRKPRQGKHRVWHARRTKTDGTVRTKRHWHVRHYELFVILLLLFVSLPFDMKQGARGCVSTLFNWPRNDGQHERHREVGGDDEGKYGIYTVVALTAPPLGVIGPHPRGNWPWELPG